MRKRIDWCKSRWFLFLTSFLLGFIPLYPKLPLIDIMRTWVYIRLEDVFIGLALASLAVFLIAKRKAPEAPLTAPIILYWVVGGLSTLAAVLFLRNQIPNFFPHLALLHFLRRIEYMGVFFIGFYAIWKKPERIPVIIWTLSVTLFAVVVYGAGQKFLGWPAFLTMNEEFAKGLPLRLPPTARIPSTFGGHYDLGAYLVFLIPLFGSLAFGMKRVWQRILMLLLAVSGLVTLLFTASRISFGVYLVAVTVLLLWKKKYWYIVPVFLVSFVLLNSVSTASERFYKTLRFSDVVIDLSTGQPVGTLDQLENGKAVINKAENPATENLPKGSEFLAAPPQKGSNTPAKTVKTIEYYTSSPLATGSGEIATVSGSFLVQKAFVYDISITTRFQGEWPLAMAAFSRNILLGSGFSSLSVATDGDYMRMLGETGILGSVAFLGIFLMAFWIFFKKRGTLPSLEESFVTGVFAGIIGLFLNAILIDVFEASKVAYVLWLTLGVAIGLLWTHPSSVSYRTLIWKTVTSTFTQCLLLCIFVFVLYKDALSLYFIGDDFTWLRWAASAALSDIPKYFTDASGFFYRPVTKSFYFLLYSVFWLKSAAFHTVMVGLFALLSVAVYWILRLSSVRSWIAFLIVGLFASMAIHHENVIWVSGASSLLSSLFLVFSVISLLYWRYASGVRKALLWFCVLLCSFLSAGSYEGGSVTAFVVAALIIGMHRASVATLVSLAAIDGLYWYLRTISHAVSPSGDYAVRLSAIVVNSVSNAGGYLLSLFVGPRMVEWMGALRSFARQEGGILTIVLGFLGVGVLFLSVRFRLFTRMKRAGMIGAWFGASLIALIPYIGLGGMAERYALAASVCVTVAVGLLFERMQRKLWVLFTGVLIILSLLTWNATELIRIEKDWMYASHVAESAVVSLKTTYFPLKDKQAFVFVNTPIRYGRAWIFPTGLTDALWHMFKFNQYPYVIYTASTIKDAFLISSPIGVPDVLVFDERGNLSKAHKEIKTIPE